MVYDKFVDLDVVVIKTFVNKGSDLLLTREIPFHNQYQISPTNFMRKAMMLLINDVLICVNTKL